MVDKLPLYGNISFDAKPEAVPYNYRISYKVSQLCLIMYICGRGNSCSLIKLQMISCALFSRESMDKLINFSNRIDESLIGCKLVKIELKTGVVLLSPTK